MKIIQDGLSLHDFPAWSGAKETKDRIIEEGKADEFEELIAELYPDGLTDTQLNDILTDAGIDTNISTKKKLAKKYGITPKTTAKEAENIIHKIIEDFSAGEMI